ncbi:hypothetical protein D9M71_328870 [compost metagenome]
MAGRHGPDGDCANLRDGPGRRAVRHCEGRYAWLAECRCWRHRCCGDRSGDLVACRNVERPNPPRCLVPEHPGDGHGLARASAAARSRRGYRSYRYRRPGTRPGHGQRRHVVVGSDAVREPECLHVASADGQGARRVRRPVFPCPCPCLCPCDHRRHRCRSDRRRAGHVDCAGCACPDARALQAFPPRWCLHRSPSGRRRRFSAWSCVRCFSAVFLRPGLPAKSPRPNDRHGRYGRYGVRSLHRHSAVRS